MSATKPTKYYSSKQEQMIADYLGWSVVVASGARMFNPGDIKSSDYLCECKTHTSKQSRVVIMKSVWKKISSEAMSVFKKPVLFFDNGTQKIQDTWCVIPDYNYKDSVHTVLFDGMKDSNAQISFEHKLLLDFLHQDECIKFSIDNESLLLMKIETFKNIIQE